MSRKPVNLIQELLKGATDKPVVHALVAPDATYVSPTFDNTELSKVMPWAGTHKDGREGILSTFRDVNRWWTIDLNPRTTFGDDKSAAVFGDFTVTSNTTGKSFNSPFPVFIKVREGLATYIQYMEDTFGTGATFRTGGEWTFGSDPSGCRAAV